MINYVRNSRNASSMLFVRDTGRTRCVVRVQRGGNKTKYTELTVREVGADDDGITFYGETPRSIMLHKAHVTVIM